MNKLVLDWESTLQFFKMDTLRFLGIFLVLCGLYATQTEAVCGYEVSTSRKTVEYQATGSNRILFSHATKQSQI